jgi:hypothetical protein
MCDFPSWTETKDGNVYWLTDALCDEHGISYVDGCGHTAIAKVWKVDGDHKEFPKDGLPPAEFLTDIKRGNCRLMALASDFLVWSPEYTENADGSKEWCRDGKRHRDGDLPAVEYADGYKAWWRGGGLLMMAMGAIEAECA